MVNRFTSGNAALTLKVVGIILIVSFLLDFLILLFPFQPTDRIWQISIATALVDRGIVPLVGVGALFTGYWIQETSDSPKGFDFRFPVLVLSSILGLLFLLIFPLHLNNVGKASDQTVNQIKQRADIQENRLNAQFTEIQTRLNTDQGKAQLEQLRNQAKAELNAILQDPQRYKQIIDSPQASPDLKELLKKAKTNPQEVDNFITQRFDIQAARNQQLNLIRTQKAADEKQTKENAWKSGMRIGISSLLLSIGYIIIGWSGLRGMGAMQGGKPKGKAPAR